MPPDTLTTVRKFVITLLVLAVVLVAADFGLRVYAEYRTGDAIGTRLKTPTRPDVAIGGFPFLLHAAQGEYPTVAVTAANFDNGALPGIRAVLDLTDVALPPGDAISGDTSRLTAQGSALQVHVPLTSVTSALARDDLSLGAAPDGALAVTTTLSVAGQKFPLTGHATVGVADNTMTISVDSLTAAGINVTPVVTAAANALAGNLHFSFPLAGLPFTVTKAGVSVVGDDVLVSVNTGPVAFADLAKTP